jgi:hypothetical protein
MWARVNLGQVTEIINRPKSLLIQNVQYPKSIFGISWSDIERKALGIVPYVYSGTRKNKMFYKHREESPDVRENSVVVNYINIVRDINEIKTKMKNQINEVLAASLSQTDWIVIRKVDIGKEAPVNLAQWRTDLRARAVELEKAIDGASSVSELENLNIQEWPRSPR